jgi:signal transduction histidine kinase
VVAAVLDASYIAEVGLALLVVVTAVRRAARDVDSAQGAALSRYADAQIDEATESERVRTDALVHDSVLTTFLSAASAQTPEAKALAARMAVHTMTVLSRATVASQVGPKVATAELLQRIREDAGGVADHFEFATKDVRDHFVPENVADAITSAAVQAMTNSVKHAGGPEVPRSVLVQGTADGAVRVRVEDHGRGFDPSKVASERLGLRVSIMERMNRVSGAVDLRTELGRGTTFVLSWPASASSPAPAPAVVDRAVLA